MSAAGPTPEELQAQLEEQLKRLTVEDVVVQTAVTLVNLGARRLGLAGDPEERDPAQARQAIEGVRALLPLVPGEESAPIRDALSRLQMTYARQARGGPPAPAGAGSAPAPGTPPGGPAPPSAEDAERAKARAKIWTPPGS